MGALSRTTAKRKHGATVQDAFNFSVTVCYAMRALQDHLDNVDAGRGVLLSPFYYAANQNSVADLKKHVTKFEASLSAYMLLSVFSFFEAFAKAIIDELIEFHGGIETMIRRAERRDKRFIAKITKEMSIQRYKLREKKKLGRGDRYRKYTRTLEDQGFRFPAETLSSYGVRKFAEDLSRLKAHAIPDFLIHALHVPLDPADVRYFHKIRGIRNDIVHGNTVLWT